MAQGKIMTKVWLYFCIWKVMLLECIDQNVFSFLCWSRRLHITAAVKYFPTVKRVFLSDIEKFKREFQEFLEIEQFKQWWIVAQTWLGILWLCLQDLKKEASQSVFPEAITNLMSLLWLVSNMINLAKLPSCMQYWAFAKK